MNDLVERPDSQRTFTTEDIADMFGKRTNTILVAARKLCINAGKQVRSDGHGMRFVFTYQQYRQIREYFQKTDRMNRRAAPGRKAAAESFAMTDEAHPLVTDPRCLDPNWWPDTVPDCFLDDEE